MDESKAKYHHLVPKTYMSAWANESGTLQVEFLDKPDVLVPRNKENIAGITDYHSIKAGMLICTEEDTKKIFSPVSEYIVMIDGEINYNILIKNVMTRLLRKSANKLPTSGMSR